MRIMKILSPFLMPDHATLDNAMKHRLPLVEGVDVLTSGILSMSMAVSAWRSCPKGSPRRLSAVESCEHDTEDTAVGVT